MTQARKLWLCLPPTLLGLIDNGVTLWFQPDEYWAGDYETAREANGLFCWLMQLHPAAFEAGTLIYIALVWALILWLPKRLALVLSLAATIGHTWGTSSWIAYSMADGYWPTLGLCALAAVIVVFAWDSAGSLKS